MIWSVILGLVLLLKLQFYYLSMEQILVPDQVDGKRSLYIANTQHNEAIKDCIFVKEF